MDPPFECPRGRSGKRNRECFSAVLVTRRKHHWFFADAKLKALDVADGTIQVLSEVSPQSGGASWGSDGAILFASRHASSVRSSGNALAYISSQGGKVTYRPCLSGDDVVHNNPAFLPDGKHFLYQVDGRANQARIEMGSLGSSDSKLVLENAHSPGYSDGFLLFVREGKVFAQRFDTGSGRLSGGAILLAESGSYSVGGRSVLAFQSNSPEARLQWYDREGKPLGTIGPVAFYLNVKLSPNGKQALTVVDLVDRRTSSFGGSDLWSLPADGGESNRLTYGKDWKGWAVWSPDGKYIAHSAESDGKATLVRRAADGSGQEETLLTLDASFLTHPWWIGRLTDATFPTMPSIRKKAAGRIGSSHCLGIGNRSRLLPLTPRNMTATFRRTVIGWRTFPTSPGALKYTSFPFLDQAASIRSRGLAAGTCAGVAKTSCTF